MIDTLKSRRFLHDFDWLLLAAALLLSAVSVLEIYSATQSQGDNYHLRQAAWVAIGMLLLFISASLDYRTVSEHIPLLYIATVLVLAYTLIFGNTVSGAKSWVSIGPVGFQPSEFAKLVVIVALARYLSELHGRYVTVGQMLKATLIVGIPMSLVVAQPDLGTALTYVPVLGLGLFIRGIRPAVLIAGALIVVLLLPASWLLLRDYQKDRILTFVNPDRDPLGRGYQVRQSRIAVGSGGVMGKGLFNGTQSQLGFLPTRHTDFILSVVGEELGFAGIVVTIGLLMVIIVRSIYHAQTARDALGLFIVMGVVSVFVFHSLVNVGMVIGFVPTTGIPLPFLSYGGSSMLTAFAGIGLIIGVRRRRNVN